MALTLPIEIGKKYVRRDGKIVITREWGSASGYVTVNTDDESLSYSTVAYRITGRIDSSVGSDRLEDLVADYVEQKGHEHADKMAEYALDAAETDKPWERWQFKRKGFQNWLNIGASPTWDKDLEYRRKPRTITINGREIEGQTMETPTANKEYWTIGCFGPDWFVWGNDPLDDQLLKAGRVFATKEAAQAAYDAITSLLVPKE